MDVVHGTRLWLNIDESMAGKGLLCPVLRPSEMPHTKLLKSRNVVKRKFSPVFGRTPSEGAIPLALFSALLKFEHPPPETYTKVYATVWCLGGCSNPIGVWLGWVIRMWEKRGGQGWELVAEIYMWIRRGSRDWYFSENHCSQVIILLGQSFALLLIGLAYEVSKAFPLIKLLENLSKMEHEMCFCKCGSVN